MKKILIAAVLAAATSTTAYAAPLPLGLVYDVQVAGIIYNGDGSQVGTTTGVGTSSVIFAPNAFFMTTANTITYTSPSLSSIVTNSTGGYFNATDFLENGEMNPISWSIRTTACEDIETLRFTSICDRNPIGQENNTLTAIDSTIGEDASSIVQFTTTVISSDQPSVGDVTTVSNFTWTLTSTTPNPVPVPAAAWLFGSALVGLAGIGRKRKAA